MYAWLWTIPALPLAGFLALALAGGRLSRRAGAAIGCGAAGLAAAIAIAIGIEFLASPPPGGAFAQQLWSWWQVGALRPGITLYLDPLSLVFTLVVTVVGFLIHIYSIGYMRGDEAYNRFFAYLNLFVGAMLMLVLGSNLVLLYLGWEGVGLCSYLLIGFWYRDPANGAAARKAFVVTRIGDTAMAIGLFLLFWQLGTLELPALLERAAGTWPVGSGLATATALLLLGGAVGKSAQLPLQTWLPDAMAGPTPVSALIHAATMVTAGVYLIARTHVIFSLAPFALWMVGIVGAVTLLLAGCSALVQTDIKRVLAYSTISQIGYMFLALGVGAWSAAVMHFMTHAFFKALLFMGAGAVILALHHEQEIGRMGGLWRRLPVTFWTFVIGGASLAALPLVTSGFYSKDWILWEAWLAGGAHRWLWAAGLAGAFLTALYTGRLVFLVFFGPERTAVSRPPGTAMRLPLVVLAALATVGGFVEIPATLGRLPLFSRFLAGTFGGGAHEQAYDAAHGAVHAAATGAAHATAHGHTAEALLQLLAVLVTLAGLGLAYWIFLRRRELSTRLATSGLGRGLSRFWLAGWGFDALYDALIVRPFVALARLNRADLFDQISRGLAGLARLAHGGLAATQTGRLALYAMGIVLGAIVAIAWMVWG